MSASHTRPPVAADETTTLRGYLDEQRATLLRQAEGLGADQLRQILAPSTMTLGGLLKHLAFVEDFWFNRILLDHPAAPPFDTVDWESDPDWDWHSAADDAPEVLRQTLVGAIERSDQILDRLLAEGATLDLRARRRRHGDAASLRWILLHMIAEYARHCGHADLLRESVDGTTGL